MALRVMQIFVPENGSEHSINLAGVYVFLVQGVRPRGWWETKRAKKSTFGVIVFWVLMLAILWWAMWAGS